MEEIDLSRYYEHPNCVEMRVLANTLYVFDKVTYVPEGKKPDEGRLVLSAIEDQGNEYFVIEYLEGEEEPMRFSSEYFLSSEGDQAILRFMERSKQEFIAHKKEGTWTLEEIRIRQTKKLIYDSHYDYLDAILEEFWKEVFGKTASEMFFGGAVSAHGDKCYGYKREWLRVGIPFHHGALLYLLTYTKEFGLTPKHESSEWVIRNYTKYVPMIEKAENEVVSKKYN